MAYDFSQANTKFNQVVELVEADLKGVKTGRAKPSLVEDILVEAYGTKMKLKEVASITAPDASLITISPWDQSQIDPIQKALSKEQFNSAVDGHTIKVAIAPLTGEKREELVKQVATKIESGKQMARNTRNEIKRQIEDQEKQGGVSEDEVHTDLEHLDKLTQQTNAKLEELESAKVTELRTL